VNLPVPSDAQLLRTRLAVEEHDLVDRLAALEARVRRFADVERPAFASWRRLEFGPLLATLQELSDELRMRSLLADRLSALVELHGLHPREALHHLTHPEPRPARPADGAFDPDEVEARRRAKLERKRAERRAAKREQRAANRPSQPQAAGAAAAGAGVRPGRVVDLYRVLARRIHPDSPSALRTLEPARRGALWTDVQDAYEAGSLERLLAISAWVETLVEADAGDAARPERLATAGASERGGALLSLSERYERLRGLRRAQRALERQLSELRADPAWTFTEQRPAARRKLAKQARAAIDDDIARVRSALRELDEFFAAIGPPRAPRRGRRR
jgi:hypothetical protein